MMFFGSLITGPGVDSSRAAPRRLTLIPPTANRQPVYPRSIEREGLPSLPLPSEDLEKARRLTLAVFTTRRALRLNVRALPSPLLFQLGGCIVYTFSRARLDAANRNVHAYTYVRTLCAQTTRGHTRITRKTHAESETHLFRMVLKEMGVRRSTPSLVRATSSRFSRRMRLPVSPSLAML